MVKEAEEDVRPYFERFPISPVEVRAVPEYSEKTAAGGYYQAPSLDGFGLKIYMILNRRQLLG